MDETGARGKSECNEIVAAFITDLMLLVKDCNYTDGDRQVRDQFVYGISDDELKKKLPEKGNTLTRIDAQHQFV